MTSNYDIKIAWTKETLEWSNDLIFEQTQLCLLTEPLATTASQLLFL
jgi:hypothetical protein